MAATATAAKLTIVPATPAKPADNTKRVATLESLVGKLMSASIADAVKLADTLAALYPLKPWEAKRVPMADYFGSLGIGSDETLFSLPPAARRHLVEVMFTADPKARVEDIAIMAGAGVRTIKRDKEAAGLANPNRVESQKAAAAERNTDAEDTAKPAKVRKVTTVEIDFDAVFGDMDLSQLTALRAKIDTYIDDLQS